MRAIFFPRNDYPSNVEVCNHRLGKKMTFCDCTTDIPSYVQSKMLPYAVKKHTSHSYKVGSDFMDVYKDSAWNSAYGKQCIANGVIWPDLYFYPDPFADFSEEAVMSAYNRLLPWFKEQFGMKPIAVDYSSGYGSRYRQYLTDKFLTCDDSDTDLLKTDYGIGVGNPDNIPYSLSRYYPRLMNTRTLDNARGDIARDEAYNTEQEKGYYDNRIDEIANLIDDTLALPNGGLIINFSHWHDVVREDYDVSVNPIAVKENRIIIVDGRETTKAIHWGFEAYLDMLCKKNVNDEIYFAGRGEAVAYLVYRQFISKCHLYSPNANPNNQLIVRIETRNDLNIDPTLLLVPISIMFSTENTPLENEQIKSNNNLISLGNNHYIVEIPYSDYPMAIIEKN